MALPKLFQRIFWNNNTAPALNETNLNAMSKAIDDIDDRVIALGADVLEAVPELAEMIDEVEELSQNPPYIGTNGNWYVWNIEQGAYVDSGIDASITLTIQDVTMLSYGSTPYVTNTGTNTDPIFHLFIPRAAGISNVAKTGTSGLVDTYTITFEDGTTKTFTVTNGKGITSIAKTGTSGLVDTYTITYNDGTTSTFTVTNGETYTLPIATANALGGIKVGSNLTINANTGELSATDTTYESKSASQGGTAVSLVTTGEKYTWNNKSSITRIMLDTYGTPSANSVQYEELQLFQGETIFSRFWIDGTKHMEQTLELSTTGDTTYTFTHDDIKANTPIDVYNDQDMPYKSMTIAAGSCTIVFGPVASAVSMKVAIYLRW